MSRSRTEGFFSRGSNYGDFLGVGPDEYELPNSLPFPVILVVHQVLKEAFVVLRKGPHPIATAKEDDVTMWLRNVIQNQLFKKELVPGFSKRTFEKVTRQQEVENYDGTKIRKTPDLVFYPKFGGDSSMVLSSHYGLFIECKPVGPNHTVGQHYFDKGIIRFVNGDYAWSMTEGMMVGYEREGRTIQKHLKPAFAKGRDSLDIQGVLKPVKDEQEPLWVSEHGRKFKWPHGKGTARSIKVYHSWHSC